MNWSVAKIGTIYQKPAQAIGLSTPPIGCVLDLPGLPGGGNKIYDRSPYGNIGTITGATWKFQNGLWVLSFDGTDDIVNCGNNSSLDCSSVSLEAWIYPDGTLADHQVICGKGYDDQTLALSYFLQFQPNEVKPGITIVVAGGENPCQSPDALALSTWHHIVGVGNSSGLAIYVNAVEKSTATGKTPDTTTAQFTIGRWTKTTDKNPFDGKIALVRCYNRALSALEINNHYQQERYLFGV